MLRPSCAKTNKKVRVECDDNEQILSNTLIGDLIEKHKQLSAQVNVDATKDALEEELHKLQPNSPLNKTNPYIIQRSRELKDHIKALTKSP